MDSFKGKTVCVIGLGASGCAAARLLVAEGAKVVACDQADNGTVRRAAAELEGLGVETHLGGSTPPERAFALAVVSPGAPPTSPLVAGLPRGTRVIGELELGFQRTVCGNVAITGTNGKTTVTELVQRMLEDAGRKSEAAGNVGLPLCEVAPRSRDLETVVLEVSSFQLERIETFRPMVAALLNISPDHLDRHGNLDQYALAKSRILENQQSFDWAIVQSEAMARLQALGVRAAAKLVTFSAANRRADVYHDRGLIISRIPDWSGPLIDMADCRLVGPHNTENIMAALLIGRALRIPLEEMRQTLKSFTPAAHRYELLGEWEGVRFINDSKSTNPDSLEKALQATQNGSAAPNVILIAGGSDKGLEYYSLGPLLARRVKKALLIGEVREQLRASWSLFAPCALHDSLDRAFHEVSQTAVSGDIVLLSPGCASFDQFENYRRRGDAFRQMTLSLMAAPDAVATI